MVRTAGHLFIIVFLTFLTQLGGIAYLVAWLSGRSARKGLPIFMAAYGVLWVVATHTAPVFGREPLPCVGDGTVKMQSSLYCALNRHYVAPEVSELLEQAASAINKRFPKTSVLVLDANFPFIDGFPLLPHLSHDDGYKVDLAFFYQDNHGRYLDGATRSPIGYWAYEQPRTHEAKPCGSQTDALDLRWDFEWLQPFFADHQLEEARMRALLGWFAKQGRTYGLTKILIEPHLEERLLPGSSILRFQGCRAARHDDHLHLEIRQRKP